MCWWGCVWLNALKNKSTGTTIEFASKHENKREQYCDFFHREEACGSEQEETSMRSALLWNYIRSSWYLTSPRASGQGGFESEMVHRRYFFFLPSVRNTGSWRWRGRTGRPRSLWSSRGSEAQNPGRKPGRPWRLRLDSPEPPGFYTKTWTG